MKLFMKWLMKLPVKRLMKWFSAFVLFVAVVVQLDVIERWRHQVGSTDSNQYPWVKTALKPYRPVCPLENPSAELRNPVCQAAHPYYEPEFQIGLDGVTSSFLTSGNQMNLLQNKESFLKKMELIEQAQETIYIASLHLACSTFVDFVNIGSIGIGLSSKSSSDFVSALIAARERGVDVRLFLDGERKWRLREGKCIKHLQKNGVLVVHTHLRGEPSKSYRTHEKLFIVDGKTAITGGQNMAAWWFESTGEDNNFRDTDIELKGPVVRQIGRRYVEIWKRLMPVDSAMSAYMKHLDRLEEEDRKNKLVDRENYANWLTEKRSGICRFVAQDPHLGNHRVLDAYSMLAENATSSIRMQVPAIDVESDEYLHGFFLVLNNASEKHNIPIDLFTNTIGYVEGRMLELVDWGAFDPSTLVGFKHHYALKRTESLYRQLKNTPINIYASRSWLHSKLFLFDDIFLSVGGFNYDDSATSWSESTVLCLDSNLAQQAMQIFAEDELNSTPLARPKS